MKYNNKVSAATIARTAALLLALANQILSAFGKSPLPIESTTVEQLVTTGITTVTALINWWYNNSFTQGTEKIERQDSCKKSMGLVGRTL